MVPEKLGRILEQIQKHERPEMIAQLVCGVIDGIVSLPQLQRVSPHQGDRLRFVNLTFRPSENGKRCQFLISACLGIKTLEVHITDRKDIVISCPSHVEEPAWHPIGLNGTQDNAIVDIDTSQLIGKKLWVICVLEDGARVQKSLCF